MSNVAANTDVNMAQLPSSSASCRPGSKWDALLFAADIPRDGGESCVTPVVAAADPTTLASVGGPNNAAKDVGIPLLSVTSASGGDGTLESKVAEQCGELSTSDAMRRKRRGMIMI